MRVMTIIFLLACFIGAAASAQELGTGIDDQQQYDSADAQLRQADAELAQQQAALNDLLARESDSSQGLATTLTDANSARQGLYDAQEQLYSASSNEALLEQLVTDRRAAFEDAKSRADSAAGDLDRYRQAAIAQFEAGPAMKNATAQLQSAQEAYQQAITSADDWLRGTYEYAEKYCAMQRATEIVRAERAMHPVDPQALAKASREWIDAQSEFQGFYDRAIQNDPTIAPASARVDAASAARQSLVDQFNRDLANDATYRQLADSASSAASAASAAADEVNAAQGRLDQARQQIAQLQSIISAQNAQLAQAESTIAAYPGGGTFAIEVGVYQSRIDQLCDARFRAWRHREFYFRRLHGFDHRSRFVFHDGDHRNRDRDGHRDGRDREDRRNARDDQHHASDAGSHPIKPASVVPYGPQPRRAVVPYGPQPRRIVVPYGPQPVASGSDATPARAILPRTPRHDEPRAREDQPSAVQRTGPEPAKRDAPRRVVVPYGPQPKAPSKSPQASRPRSGPEPERSRSTPSPSHAPSPGSANPSSHRESPAPHRESPAPHRESHSDRPAKAPTPRYDSPSEPPRKSSPPARSREPAHEAPARSREPTHEAPARSREPTHEAPARSHEPAHTAPPRPSGPSPRAPSRRPDPPARSEPPRRSEPSRPRPDIGPQPSRSVDRDRGSSNGSSHDSHPSRNDTPRSDSGSSHSRGGGGASHKK